MNRRKMHRIRSIIVHLQYGSLKKSGILPKKPFFTGVKRGGTFPSVARKMGYPQFGMFIDYFIRAILSHRFQLPFELKGMTRYQIYTVCNERFFQDKQLDKTEFNKNRDYFRNIIGFVCSSFSKDETKIVELEPEWIVDNVCGHPDLIVDDTVYDIKTTGHFGSMRIQTVFQLLSYYCLAQQLGKKHITHIGVILPAQETVLRVSLSLWDWKPFWKELVGCINVKLKLQPSFTSSAMFQLAILPHIGSHVLREKSVSSTLAGLPADKPWQIFFAGRCNANFKISDVDIGKTLKLVEENGYKLYIHAPYTLNLSRKYDDNWVVNSLKRHLETAISMGCRGVVIHCGTKKHDVEHNIAYGNMYDAVVQIAENGTVECPLLIETSAGETGELLSHPAELVRFYHSLPNETQKHVKICVDTCHVFAAGYMPADFIHELDDAKVPIVLFHYNDSKGNIGCCKDRHENIGSRCIGLDNLIKIGAYAIQNGIDLVHE